MRALVWVVCGLLAGAPAFARQAEAPGAQAQVDPEQWLAEVALVNQWSIELSQRVADQAATASVRAFARDALASHQKLQEKLDALGRRANINLDEELRKARSQKSDYMHIALATSLAGIPTLNGENVDRAYLSSMVLAHDLAIEKLQWFARHAASPQVAEGIDQVLPTLKHHRDRAWKLLGKLAPRIRRSQARPAPPARR